MRGIWVIAGALCALSCNGPGPDGEDDTDGPLPTGECPDGTDLTYENFARGFIQTWCLPCHTSQLAPEDPRRQCANPQVDLDTFADVEPLVLEIDRKVNGAVGGPPPEGDGCSGQPIAPDCLCVEQSDMQMPPAGGVPEEDKALLHEWVACGAPGAEVPPPSCFTAVPSTGAVALASQAEADAFCSAGTNHVAGDLTITASLEIDCLCGVDGTVAVSGGAADVSLPSLESAGALEVVGALALTRLSAPNLRYLTVGDLAIASDPLLATLDLPWVTDVAGDAELNDLVALTELALPHLSAIGGVLHIEGVGATAADLTRVRSTGGDLVVRANPYLADVDTLKSVDSIGGSLLIDANPALVTLEMGEVLESIGGSIEVTGNAALTVIHGFTLLQPAHDLLVAGNGALLSVEGFDTLASADSITITGNENLLAVVGFPNLPTVTGALTLTDNGKLTFVALPLLVTSGDVLIAGNRLAQNLALASLTTVQGDLSIIGNTELSSLDGLAALSVVEGDLRIEDNPDLPTADATALADAAAVGGTVAISGNAP